MDKTILRTVSATSYSILVLTSIHHLYGAYAYQTPWRHHVVLIALPFFISLVLLHKRLIKRPPVHRTPVFWTYFLIVFVICFLAIGLFEGVYNHIFKNIVYFIGVDHETFVSLFPPPTYELPDNFLFESTGVLQGLISIYLIFPLVKLFRSLRNE